MADKKLRAAALLTLAIAAGSYGVGRVQAQEPGPVKYRLVSGSEGVVGRLVVRGAGCLEAEDMTQLRLVEWSPAAGRVVYRCLQP